MFHTVKIMLVNYGRPYNDDGVLKMPLFEFTLRTNEKRRYIALQEQVEKFIVRVESFSTSAIVNLSEQAFIKADLLHKDETAAHSFFFTLSVVTSNGTSQR